MQIIYVNCYLRSIKIVGALYVVKVHNMYLCNIKIL